MSENIYQILSDKFDNTVNDVEASLNTAYESNHDIMNKQDKIESELLNIFNDIIQNPNMKFDDLIGEKKPIESLKKADDTPKQNDIDLYYDHIKPTIKSFVDLLNTNQNLYDEPLLIKLLNEKPSINSTSSAKDVAILIVRAIILNFLRDKLGKDVRRYMFGAIKSGGKSRKSRKSRKSKKSKKSRKSRKSKTSKKSRKSKK